MCSEPVQRAAPPMSFQSCCSTTIHERSVDHVVMHGWMQIHTLICSTTVSRPRVMVWRSVVTDLELCLESNLSLTHNLQLMYESPLNASADGVYDLRKLQNMLQ